VTRILAIPLLAGVAAAGQTVNLTLEQAVRKALDNYPSIRISREQMEAAAAGIRLARTAYLPRVDAHTQVDRATRNNVFGLLFPQNVIPAISGPVLGTNNFGTVWGSAVGVMAAWEPFDFGLRAAQVAVAEADRVRSEAALNRSRFEVAVAAADSCMTLAAAAGTVRAARAGVERAGTVHRIIQAQVDAELRPGADVSRAAAEVAAARTQLIQAEQAADIARVAVSQYTGENPDGLSVSAPGFERLPPEQVPQPAGADMNPAVIEQDAAVAQARAQLRVLSRSFFPRFDAQAAAYARGTGARIDGTRLGGAHGLAPSVQNYAVGFSLTFPVSSLPGLRARQAAQSAAIRAETARRELIVRELRARWNAAVAALDGARRVAANIPSQVTAAHTAVQQATARYQAGLGNVTEVADAQRLLTQSEIDHALARLGVWRALLHLAAAAGDIEPFLAEAGR
jgi:outer membrane protein TolC